MYKLLTLLLVAVLVSCSSGSAENDVKYRPVVMMHGIGNTSSQLNMVVEWVRESLPGIYVVTVPVGEDEYWDSILMNVNKQVDLFSKFVKNDKELVNGFNLIGYSQGGLITRGYIQKYMSNGPKVHNYITWSSPHAGQFGIPYTNIEFIDGILAKLAYTDTVQKLVGVSEYWNDPYLHDMFLESSLYLADLNNERTAKNDTYKEQLTSLNHFRMLWSNLDETIKPQQSGGFGFVDYSDPSGTILPLEKRQLYTEDWLGLKVLKESGRLDIHEVSIPHPLYPDIEGYKLFKEYTLPLLNNTIGGI